MSLTVPDISYDLLSELTPPCESQFHEMMGCTDSAAYYIDSSCSECKRGYQYLIGDECYQLGMREYLYCFNCDRLAPGREYWTVLQVL